MTILSIFTALKGLGTLCLFFPPTPQLLTSTDYFTIYRFAFSKMSYSWNYTDIIFSDWLFSLSNIHLWFLQVFSWLESSFLLVWNNIPWSGWTTVYLFIYLLKKILAASKFKKKSVIHEARTFMNALFT